MIILFDYNRSHYIRSVILFDEKGHPKSNLKFDKNQSVEIVFDIVPEHEHTKKYNESFSLFNQSDEEEDNFNEEEFQCVFWDSQLFVWSSEGCEAIFDDKKHIGNVLPRGIVYLLE